MARVAATPIAVPATRRDFDGANASPGQTPLGSITKRMAAMGMATPQDLISTMVMDHERTGRRVIRSPASAGRQPRRQSQDSPNPIEPAARPPAAGAASPSMALDGQRVRLDTAAIKRSHWKSVDKAGKCANPSCRRRFTWKDRRSNCCMCGEVFCRPCVKFRRKLSSNADPDPLGTLHNVCHACYNHYPESGAQRNLGQEFKRERSNHQRRLKQIEQVESRAPLSQREMSSSKKVALREEVERLTEGYLHHCGMVQNLLSEVRTPDWQKSPHWRLSAQASHCFHCKKQFRIINRKIHCRVCGQVFCTDCTKDEVLLYLDDEEPPCAKWAINGKSGAPPTQPQRFELLPVCSHCSKELETMLVDDIITEPDPEEVEFLELLAPMQRELLNLQDKVEIWLPKYQTIVDSLDIIDNSPQSVEGQHPLRKLAKAQCDLSDAFSQLAMKSQNLRGLQGHARTETQQKLLKHVMLATYQFYSENMYLFRGTRDRLSEFMPLSSLEEIQSFLNQQSMERVHLVLLQIMYEALSLQNRFKFDDDCLELCIDPIRVIEVEFKAFLDKNGDGWQEHMEWVQQFVKSEMKRKQLIVVRSPELRRQTKVPLYIKYRVVLKSSSIAKSCSRELSAKTSDKEFVKTKASLQQACDKLDELVSMLKRDLALRAH